MKTAHPIMTGLAVLGFATGCMVGPEDPESPGDLEGDEGDIEGSEEEGDQELGEIAITWKLYYQGTYSGYPTYCKNRTSPTCDAVQKRTISCKHYSQTCKCHQSRNGKLHRVVITWWDTYDAWGSNGTVYDCR